MAQVVETIDIEVPVDAAYKQWANFESFPQFLSVVESIVPKDDTHDHWTVTIGGAEREFDTVITEQKTDDRIAWNSTGGEVDHAGVVTFHRLSDSTSRVAVQIDWDPEGLLEKAGAALNVPDHAVKRELQNFKNFIEEGGRAA